MAKEPSTLVFKLLAALGALSIVGMLFLAAFALRLIQQSYETGWKAPTRLNGVLGELGSSCGGTAILPCKPGLTCSSDPNVKESEGVCVEEK